MKSNKMILSTTFLLFAPATTLGAVITITRTVVATTIAPAPTLSEPSNDVPISNGGNRNAVTPGTSDYTDNAAFQANILDAHNFYRKQHGAADLVWNDTSAAFGQQWSEGCNFEHSGGPTGENLVAGGTNATASIDMWGSERKLFNFKSGGFSSEAGHFTQLVWKNTTSVGCGRTTCNGKGSTPGTYVVCEYFPQGNIVGSNNKYFRDNVGSQTSGNPSDTAVAALAGVVQSAGTGDVKSGASSISRSATSIPNFSTSFSSLLSSSTATAASSSSSAMAASVGKAFRESKGVLFFTVVVAVVLDAGM